jgi:hypothetical protein
VVPNLKVDVAISSVVQVTVALEVSVEEAMADMTGGVRSAVYIFITSLAESALFHIFTSSILPSHKLPALVIQLVPFETPPIQTGYVLS